METELNTNQGLTPANIDASFLDVSTLNRTPGFEITSVYETGLEIRPDSVVAEPSNRIIRQGERGEHRLIETSNKNKVSSVIAAELTKITGEEFTVERVDAFRSRISFEDPILALTDHLNKVDDKTIALSDIKGVTLRSAVKSLLITAKGDPALKQGRLERIILSLRKKKNIALLGRLNFPGFTLSELLKRNTLSEAINISLKVSKQALKLHQDVRRMPDKIVDKADSLKAIELRRIGLMKRAMKNFSRIADQVNSLIDEEKVATEESIKAKALLLDEVRKSIPGIEEAKLDIELAKTAVVTIQTSAGNGKTQESKVFQAASDLIKIIEAETKTPENSNLKLFALNVLIDRIYKNNKRVAGLKAAIACFPSFDQNVFLEKDKVQKEDGTVVMVDRTSLSDFVNVFMHKALQIGPVDNVKVNALLESKDVDRDLKDTIRRYLGDPYSAGRNRVEAIAGNVVGKIKKTPRISGVIAAFNRQVNEFGVMTEKIEHEREIVAEYMPLVGTLSALDSIPLYEGQNLMALRPSKMITDADGTTHIIRPRGMSIVQNASWKIKSIFNKDIGVSADPYSSLSELSSDRVRLTSIVGALVITGTLLSATLIASSLDQARRRTIRCVSVTQNLSYSEIQQKYNISATSVEETIGSFNKYRSELYTLFSTGNYSEFKLNPENWKGILDINGAPYINRDRISDSQEMKAAIYRATTLTLLELQKQNGQQTDKLTDQSKKDIRIFMVYLNTHQTEVRTIFDTYYKDDKGADYRKALKKGEDIKSSLITEIIRDNVAAIGLLEDFEASVLKAENGISEDCK